MSRQNILGIYFDNYNLYESIQKIEEFISKKVPTQHVVVNASKLVLALKDDKLRSIINNCDLINIDGQAVVWAARFLGIPCKERIAGIDLMTQLLNVAEIKEWSLYFLGATENTKINMINKLKYKYSDLNVAGWRNGYFSES